MDFELHKKTPLMFTPSRSTPEARLQGGHNSHNENSVQSSQKSENKNGHKNLPLMICRRTPIRSPNPTLASSHDFPCKRDQRLPVPLKRCFSKEVLELSRHQIVVTKQSKVDISFRPPKRIRMDDFSFASSTSHSRDQTDRNSRRKEEMKRLKPPTAKLFLEEKHGKKQQVLRRDGVKTHLFNSKTIDSSKNQRLRTSYFLVSVKNCPQIEWKGNDYDGEMLREIIFLSGAKAVPVTLIHKDGQTIVKFVRGGNSDFISGISPVAHQGIGLYNILKSPFTLSFRVISGVLRWIVGNYYLANNQKPPQSRY